MGRLNKLSFVDSKFSDNSYLCPIARLRQIEELTLGTESVM